MDVSPGESLLPARTLRPFAPSRNQPRATVAAGGAAGTLRARRIPT